MHRVSEHSSGKWKGGWILMDQSPFTATRCLRSSRFLSSGSDTPCWYYRALPCDIALNHALFLLAICKRISYSNFEGLPTTTTLSSPWAVTVITSIRPKYLHIPVWFSNTSSSLLVLVYPLSWMPNYTWLSLLKSIVTGNLNSEWVVLASPVNRWALVLRVRPVLYHAH